MRALESTMTLSPELDMGDVTFHSDYFIEMLRFFSIVECVAESVASPLLDPDFQG